MGSSDPGSVGNRFKMHLHIFGLMLFLVVTVNGEPKPDPKADPKPDPKVDPKAQMALIFPGGGNFRYQDWFVRNRYRGNRGAADYDPADWPWGPDSIPVNFPTRPWAPDIGDWPGRPAVPYGWPHG